MKLDAAAATAALGRLGQGLGVSAIAAARGVFQVVCETMAGAVRAHAADRGADHRGVPMLAFGGAGPVHACAVAELLHSTTVIFPPLASVFSALGSLVTPPRPAASLRPEMNAPVPPQVDSSGATPVMAQFFEAKSRQPDALVFFRMGDFYELFFDDARQAAAALGIALTARGQHAGEPIPMCGVPVHAAEAYLSKLIRSGFKVAVCEQMEDPAEARKRGSKAIVRRDIVRVVTPGTLKSNTGIG